MKGSVIKRGTRYSIVLDLGYEPDEHGHLKRRQKWIAAGPKKKAAEAKLADLVSAFHGGMFIEPSKLTFGTWLTQWIDALEKAGKVTPGTIQRYRGLIDRIQQHDVSHVLLQRLRPSHVERYYAALLTTLSAGTVRLHHAMIHQSLEKARKDRLVPVNVAADADRPKTPKDRGVHARAQCWTRDEARAFLAAADAAGTQPSAFYALALDTGARLRELAGLRWSNVDLDTGRLTIAHQLAGTWADHSKAPVFVPPKTGRTRKLTVSPETVNRLRAHKKAQAEQKMAFRKEYQDAGLVFATAYGRPLAVHNLGSREHDRLMKIAGVRRIKFHGLRHTVATLLLQAGVPVQDVAARLGHAKASMTLDVYAHATEDPTAAPMGAVLYG